MTAADKMTARAQYEWDRAEKAEAEAKHYAEENANLRAQLAEARAAQPLPGGWADVMSSTIQRFEVAAAINGSAVWNPVGSKAMAELLKGLSCHVDRAEAALAAQIEVDAGIASSFRDGRGLGRGKPCIPDQIAIEIRNQPHDRTALKRHDAKTREKALQKAAEKLKDFGYKAAVRAILALIETPQEGGAG